MNTKKDRHEWDEHFLSEHSLMDYGRAALTSLDDGRAQPRAGHSR